MFASPFEWCKVCKDYVLLDQSHRQCAREHGCQLIDCPFAKYFTGPDVKAGDNANDKDPASDKTHRIR
jgi:hypothetical protein